MALAENQITLEVVEDGNAIYTEEPASPYESGDLYVKTEEVTNGLVTDADDVLIDSDSNEFEVVERGEANVYVCKNDRPSGVFNPDDWQLAATDNTQLNQLKEHFWYDDAGAHVQGETTGFRNDITSTGMKIVDTSTDKTYAEFGTAGVKVGERTKTHVDISDNLIHMNDGAQDLFTVYKSDTTDSLNYRNFPYIETTVADSPANIREYYLSDAMEEKIIWGEGGQDDPYKDVHLYVNGSEVDTSDFYSYPYYFSVSFSLLWRDRPATTYHDYNLFFGSTSTVTIQADSTYDETGYITVSYDASSKKLTIYHNLFVDDEVSPDGNGAMYVIEYVYQGSPGNLIVTGEIEDGHGNQLSNKSDFPIYKKVSVTKSFNVSANSYTTVDFAPAAQSKYTRVGLIGWNTASTNVFIATCTGTSIVFGNKSSSAQTCNNAQVDWLFLRSSN